MIAPPATGQFTVADLDQLPEGLRAELYDGQLVVNAAPSRLHQRIVFALATVLNRSVPDGLEVVIAPFDWQIDDTRMLEPDVLVVPWREDEKRFVGTPHLVAEVLSPATRVVDLTAKRRMYEEAGVPTYLVVDPAVPSVTVFEFIAGELVETRAASGDDSVTVGAEFPIEISPTQLLS